MHATLDPLGERLRATWGPTCETERETWSRTLHPLEAPQHPGRGGVAGAAKADAADVQLLAEIGRGGMGEVWCAEQRSLGREVAVKVPRASAASGEGAPPVPMRASSDALRAEARLVGALEHPHIIPVHALLASEDGRPMMVMKRVQGATLDELAHAPDHPLWRDLLERHGDRERTFLECLVRVADALAFAHSRGFLHRDVKPENIMVGEFGETYLMDWGCAAAVGATATVAGTPAFMAPEMLRASENPLDARSDVYLVGATLHAILTLAPRHAAATLPALLDVIRDSAPIAYAPGSVAPDLAVLCNRATARDPAGRPASMGELRVALVEALRLRASLSIVGRILAQVGLDEEGAPDEARLARLREAHHALAPLSQEWPNQPAVQEPLERVLAAIVGCALHLGRREEAEAAFAMLSHPAPELVEWMRAAGSDAEAARGHAALGAAELRERDVRPSLKGALAMLGFMACNAVFQVVFLEGGDAPSMREVFLADVFATGLVVVGVLRFRRALLANRRGRSTTAAIFLLVLGMSASDGLSALAGQSVEAATPFSLFAGGLGFAALATLLDLPPRSRWVAGVSAVLFLTEAVVATQVPALAASLLTLSVVESVIAAGLLVMEMVREGVGSSRAAR